MISLVQNVTCSFYSLSVHKRFCFVRAILPWHKCTSLKKNTEHAGKPISKFSPEIIALSDSIFGEVSGKWGYKAVAHVTCMESKKNLCRQIACGAQRDAAENTEGSPCPI